MNEQIFPRKTLIASLLCFYFLILAPIFSFSSEFSSDQNPQFVKHCQQLLLDLNKADLVSSYYQNQLGDLYSHKDKSISEYLKFSKSYEEAIKWYRKAADQGLADAQYRLGCLYSNFEADDLLRTIAYEHDSIEWFRKAALQGHSDAQFYLGQFLDNGWETPKNPHEAMKWYMKSAQNNNPHALYALAVHFDGESDFDEAFKFYTKAAQAGDSFSQYILGGIYSHDELKSIQEYRNIINLDYERAVFWYEKAALQGERLALIRSADIYFEGKGIPRDYSAAAKWYQEAANEGFPSAQNRLGNMYLRGQGVSQDYSKAIEWHKKAADQGKSNDSMQTLGDCYFYGYV